MAGEQDQDKGYTWETEYERTWEALQEDADGSLQQSVRDVMHHAKRRRQMTRPHNVKLGMMRHLFLVIDMSHVMKDQDLHPTRFTATLKLLEFFIEEYFDQNPISQLGIIVTKNKRAEKIAELGGNPRRHIACLEKLKKEVCEGEASLQNSLELAYATLKNMPGHASREVLMVLGSLTSCDPGNIYDTIKCMKSNNVQVSIVGLSASVHICQQICKSTHGKYNVILDETHYKDLLTMHLAPPTATANTESSLIKMGFPHHYLESENGDLNIPSMCMCHLESKSKDDASNGAASTSTGTNGVADAGSDKPGYFCPQCKSKYCELPTECKVCNLTLVSAPHLARSYHHLFPLDLFQEIKLSSLHSITDKYCFACQKLLKDSTVYRCSKCQQLFCIDCDLFIHNILHSCPGCASSRATQEWDKAITIT